MNQLTTKDLTPLLLLVFVLLAEGSVRAAETMPMTLEDVSRLAIADNLGIRIFRNEDNSFSENEAIEKSFYDSVVYADVEWTRDQSDNASVFAPSLSRTTTVESGIRKEFPSGTLVDVSVLGERIDTNSAFVSLNPSFESRGKVELKQRVSGNAFGIDERLRLEQVSLDVRKFNYETLEKIENELFNIREIFWRVVQEIKVLEIRKEALQDAQDFLKVTEEKVKLGLLEKPDLFAAKANVQERLIDRIIASNQVQDRESELKTMLKIALDYPANLLWEDKTDPVPLDKNSWIKLALENRYDKKKAELEIKRQGLQVRMTEAQLWPTLDLEGSFEANSLDDTLAASINDTAANESPKYFVGMIFEFPLENREAGSKHKQAKLDKAKALLSLQKEENEILRDVDISFRGLILDYERIVKTREIVELQRQKLSEEMLQFERGRSSSDTIIDFQRDYQDSRIKAAEAFSDYHIQVDTLAKASGQLLAEFQS